MKRIGIFLGSDPNSGGIFQYSLALLEALSTLPCEQYATVAAFFDPAWRPYVEPLGVQVLPLSASGREPLTLGRIWRMLCLSVKLWRKLFWRLDPVARILYGLKCDLWIFPAQDHWTYLAPVPALGVIHDLMHRYEPEFPEVSRWGRYFLREYRFRNICRYSGAVLVDSEVGRTQVIESYGISPDKIFPLPYLPPRYIYDTRTPDGFDSRYSLPSRFLFYPAQFWQHKNHDRLLQAIALARKTCGDIHLVLVGSKRHEYRRLIHRVEELKLEGHITFTGYVPDKDMAEFYLRARALVMPTFFGPTNIPPLEAFACGCPVAVSNIYGMPEQTGGAALLFDPLSVESMSDMLERLWVDDQLCETLREKGFERAKMWSQLQFGNKVHSMIGYFVDRAEQVDKRDMKEVE